MAKNDKVKSRHRFLIPNKHRISVHKVAELAYKAWLNCQVGYRNINLSRVDDYHKPPIRLIEIQNAYYYFYSFERMRSIIQFEADLRQPFIISTSNEWDMKKMAWAEVLQLAFMRDVNHALLWKTLKNDCPASILKELMQVTSLEKKDYANFAGIELHQLDYQQRLMPTKNRPLGLPSDMSWVNKIR